MPCKRHAVLRAASFYSDKMTSVSIDLHMLEGCLTQWGVSSIGAEADPWPVFHCVCFCD